LSEFYIFTTELPRVFVNHQELSGNVLLSTVVFFSFQSMIYLCLCQIYRYLLFLIKIVHASLSNACCCST